MIRVLVAVTMLSACKPGPAQKPACVSPEDRKALAEFIVRCAEAANPKSDEEGEDLVAQCEWTGERVVCPLAKHCFNRDSHSWEPCS